MESLEHREQSIAARLRSSQTGINDPNGKGMDTENVVEEELLRPFLPLGYGCGKGAVVSAEAPTQQSEAIDRIVFDRRAAAPMVYSPAHSIFPIEMVAGLVEITMRLDATKLRTDIVRMQPVKGMRRRRFVASVPGTRTRVHQAESKGFLSPRSFIIGLPADETWRAETIAQALRSIQRELGPPAHVHGLYVIGIGFFRTIPVETPEEPMYRIAACTGPDRMFRFTEEFRWAFDRWESVPQGSSVDLSDYVPGEWKVLAE